MSLLQAGVALEVIALWLGHAKPLTTRGYIEADLKMKADCLKRLTEPALLRRRSTQESSRLLTFLEAILIMPRNNHQEPTPMLICPDCSALLASRHKKRNPKLWITFSFAFVCFNIRNGLRYC